MEFNVGDKVDVYEDYTNYKRGGGVVVGHEPTLSYSVIVEVDYADAGTSRVRYFRPEQLRHQSLGSMFAGLAQIPGNGWKKFDDPVEELRKMNED